MEARRPEMIFCEPLIAPVLPRHNQSPILLEGYVLEMPSRSVRKMVLLRDKLNVFTCPGVEEGSPYGDPVESTELPIVVYSFPLSFVRFEKLRAYGLQLYDTRKGDSDDGVIMLNETEEQNNFWIECLLEQIYA